MNEDLLIFALLLIFGAFYALLLEFSERWLRLVSRATWLTVVVGVGMTLGLCGLFKLFTEFTYWRVWAAFGCTGTPVVFRSILRWLLHENAMRQEAIRHATPRE